MQNAQLDWTGTPPDHPDAPITDDAALAADSQDEQGILFTQIDALIEAADQDIPYKVMADAFLSGPEHFYRLWQKAIAPHHRAALQAAFDNGEK